MPHHLTYAEIIWKGDVPCSTEFDDIYFSRAGGVEETHHVFIDGNHLNERFLNSNCHFTIIETGFGTGLNFLTTAELWLRTASSNAVLHFISTEKFPLTPTDLAKALSFFPDFKTLSNELVAQYPPAISGTHRIYLADGRIVLTLLLGDINNTLPTLSAQADAWFLDGFAPAKNESMWSDTLFKELARLSKPNATLATYSAAGAVRRALSSVGFEVEKAKGFGHKRDMVKAIFNDSPPTASSSTISPWFETDTSLQLNKTTKHAVIIGAGLAGCFAAVSLAKRGFKVDIIERYSHSCSEASGNPYGIIQPAITASEDIAGQFHLAGCLHSLNLLKRLNIPHQQTGAIHFGHKREGKENILHAALLHPLSKTAFKEISHINTEHSEAPYFLTISSFLEPKRFAEQALEPYKDQIHYNFECEAISLNKQDAEWQIQDVNQQVIANAPIVVIANANDARQFSQTSWLPLQSVRGQLSYIPATENSQNLKTILCHDTGYILPADKDGYHCVGATYEPFLNDKTLLNSSHQRNLDGFECIFGKHNSTKAEMLDGRTSFRATSPERLPYIGPVPDANFFQTHYAGLHHSTQKNYPKGSYQTGLYLSTAHGSRGLSSTPLAGEIIASYITGEPMPISTSLLHATHPARWPIRRLKKGKSFT